MKRQATDLEIISADHIAEKRHGSGMGKGLSKLENMNSLI